MTDPKLTEAMKIWREACEAQNEAYYAAGEQPNDPEGDKQCAIADQAAAQVIATALAEKDAVIEGLPELLRRTANLIAVAADNKDPLEPVADNGMTVWDCFVTESQTLLPRIKAALAQAKGASHAG